MPWRWPHLFSPITGQLYCKHHWAKIGNVYPWIQSPYSWLNGHARVDAVENLGLLATPFGQALRALALTCDVLRSLWWRSSLHGSRCKFFTVWPTNPSQRKLSDVQSLLQQPISQWNTLRISVMEDRCLERGIFYNLLVFAVRLATQRNSLRKFG